MRFGFVVLIGIALIGAARGAEAIPEYDSAKFCSNTSALWTGNMKAAMESSCQKREDEYRAKVRRVWTQTPDDIIDGCVKLATFGPGGPSYQGLGGCLSLGVGAAWLDGKVTIARP